MTVWAIVILVILYIFWRIVSGIYSTTLQLFQKYRFGISVFLVAAILTAISYYAIDSKTVFLAIPLTYLLAYSWKAIQINEQKRQQKIMQERAMEEERRQKEMDFQREQAEREAQIRREEAASRERMHQEQIKYDEKVRQESFQRKQRELEFQNRTELETFLRKECARMGAVTEEDLKKASFRFREKDYPENDPYEKIVHRFLEQCMAEFERMVESIICNQCRVQPSSEPQLIRFVKESDLLADYTYENTKSPEVLVNQALSTLLRNNLLSKVGEEYLLPHSYGRSGVEQQPELSIDDL